MNKPKKKYNITKPQKLKTMSIKTWCEKNNRNDILELWDYDLNKYDPNVVSWASGYKIYFKCPNGKHKSRSIVLSSVTIGGNKLECKQCYLEEHSFGRWCEYNMPELLGLWDDKLNNCSPYDIGSKSSKKYYFKCPKGLHESSLHSLSHITTRNFKIYCKKCNSFAQYLLDNFGDDSLIKIWDINKNEISPYDVSRSSSRKKVWVHCLENESHDSYLVSPDNFSRGRRCPQCKQENQNSKLARKVNKYLKDRYDYQLLHEYQCTIICRNPENGYILPYDNQLIVNDKNLFIEVNGVQHYEITGYITVEAEKYDITPEEMLLRRQKLDKYKKDYIESLDNCYYLAIPYWAEQDESYKTLIDNKINEILTIQN